MIAALGQSETEQFRDLIARRFGLSFDDAKLGFLAELLRRRSEATSQSGDAYLGQLLRAPAAEELAVLAQELTVGETYFFRNGEQFRALAEICLPERIRARGAEHRLHLLSAGCASGEEAYTLAILRQELLPDPAWVVSILGVDVNATVLAKAARGSFTSWSLRETTPEMQQRWFRPDGRDAVLDETIRAAVRFEQRNLTEDDPALWPAQLYDVVFCRNVIMYLTPDHAQRLIGRIASALAPGGYLFLGHAETLRGISRDFHLCQTHGTFYYRRKGAGGAPEEPVPPVRAHVSRQEVVIAEGWFETIRRASERVSVLTGPQPLATPPVAQPVDLGQVVELLRRERFAEALGLVESHPAVAARDPEALLLRAVLLTHNHQTSEAEACCRILLGIDELNAGAHYLLALCSEDAGNPAAAIGHDQVAIYLDRAFAMPQLHLGLLASKRNDRGAARRAFAQAEVLLQREDPSRLLLFGGGFSRESLIALCRTALAAEGGAA